MNYMGLYLLIGICVVLAVFFMVRNSKPAAARSVDNIDKESEKELMPQQSTQVNDDDRALMDDGELVAVISAAIAASLGSQSKIVVRNIRRVYDPTPVWAKTGRTDVMASRF